MSDARILGNGELNEGWRLVRVQRPTDAPLPAPGQWYWLEHNGERWVLPVHRAPAGADWVAGLIPPDQDAERLRPEAVIDLTGPEGEPLPSVTDGAALIVGSGAGVGAALALAEAIEPLPWLVLLDASRGIPGRICPSRFMVRCLPAEAMAGVASLERAGIPSRIASPEGRPGCFEGSGSDMLRHLVADLSTEERAAHPLIACTSWSDIARWRGELAALVPSLHLCQLPGH